MLFHRSALNPILTPGEAWWEARGVLNPGAVLFDDRIALVYRAVGADGISRFGLAWASGDRIIDRLPLPFYEAPLDAPLARLGVEDPRITPLDGRYLLTYTMASTAPAETPKLSWEPAPFRVRSVIGATDDFRRMEPISTILPDENTKDSVLFPVRFGGRYAALVRSYPSIQYLHSQDMRSWSNPVEVMGPIPGTWEGERIGAGPPPIETPWGWLLLYHANEYLRMPGNLRLYRMGLAVLDRDEPWRVLYRHPRPIFEPTAPYETHGPVGNVVFGEGLVRRDGTWYLYYGAGDGVIGMASTTQEEIDALLRQVLGEPDRSRHIQC